MATFYKYAERSAESQVNWAEIGKDMTDMLRQEVAVRDQKKAAIDEATRKLAQEVSNAPQGESVSAKEEAIRLADQVTKYMTQQERLLKSGLLDPKEYMIARQNLTDGTRQAYQTMKDFQAKYGELMEGVRKGTTSIISVKELEKIQGYGNFRQSGFFIDSPTGKLNVGLKEYQDIDGEKVIGLKPGSTVGMQYIQGGIYGIRDVYDYRKDITDLSKSLGEEIRVTLDPATMSKIGTAKTLSDLRQRVIKVATEDPTKEKELFNFYDAMEKALDGYLVNENNLGSLLADTMGYDWTDNAEDAKKNPNTVLGGVDPNTGQPSLEFTDKNRQDAKDFMMQQFLGTIKVEEKIQGMGQVQLQTEPEWKANQRTGDKENEIAAGYWNDILSAKNIQEAQAAADVLIGTPRAIEMELTEMDFTSNPGSVVLKYANPAMDRTIKMFDDSGRPVNRRDWAALGVELHGVVDRDKAIKAGGGTKEYGGLTKEQYTNIGTKRQGVEPTTKFNVPSDAFTSESPEAAVALQEAFGPDFIVEDLTPNEWDIGNRVKVTAPNGTTRTFNTDIDENSAADIKKEAEDWAKANNKRPKPKEQSDTTEKGATGSIGTTPTGTVNYAIK